MLVLVEVSLALALTLASFVVLQVCNHSMHRHKLVHIPAKDAMSVNVSY